MRVPKSRTVSHAMSFVPMAVGLFNNNKRRK